MSVSGTSVVYVAAAGESNVLTFATIGNDVIIDDSVDLTPGAGCTQGADTTIATCTGAGLSRIDADTGDLDDTVSVSGAISMTLHAGSGDDTATGSDGNDAIYGEAGLDTINGGTGGDLIDGGADDDVLRGNEGDDILLGGAGIDQLEGDDGVDRLDGGPGADTLNGGFGSDWVEYTSSSGPVTVDVSDPGLDGGIDDGAGDQLSDLENIRGSAFADTLIGNNIPNEIDGGAGADSINGGTDQDIVSYATRTTPVSVNLNDSNPDGGIEDGAGDTLTGIEGARGGNGNDTLTGDSGPNTLDGQSGDDVLNGLAGADYLVGGIGFDTADYSDRLVSIVADLDGAADDGASGENDRIETDVEAILGGSGADVLNGNNGANTLSGGPGDDVLGGALGADVLIGGDGIDSVSYVTRTGDLTVTLDGVADDGETGEGDSVAADIENVTGGLGDDLIIGSAVANTLQGGPGDDILDGGGGADVLSGGIGVDTVDYSARTLAVSVDLDGIPDDGEAGEGDNVITDIEDILGG
ncbi:MAG: calcium-binding protein, partial [Gaiellaceae bacterium]